MYSFRFDARRRLLHVRMRGLWSEAVITSYMAAFGREIGRCARMGLTIGVLVDGRGAPVQRADLGARFQALAAGQPTSGPATVAAVAIVSSTALNHLQIRRLYGDAVGAFHTIEDAAAYLIDRLADTHHGARETPAGECEPAERRRETAV